MAFTSPPATSTCRDPAGVKALLILLALSVLLKSCPFAHLPQACVFPQPVLLVLGFLRFGGFLKLHVAKLIGVKDLATLHALDILGVFVPGNDTYLGVLADGCHRFGFVGLNFSFRKIVAVFSTIWNGFLVNLYS